MSKDEPGLKVHQQSKSDDDHSERKIKELHVPPPFLCFGNYDGNDPPRRW
jgi:hypothetical protein